MSTGAEDGRALSQRLSLSAALSRVSLPKAALGRRANQTAAVCITGANPTKGKVDCLTGPSLALKPCNRSISPATPLNNFPHQTQTPPDSQTQHNPPTSPISLKQTTLHKPTTRQNVQGIHLQRCVRAHLESKSHQTTVITPRNRQRALTPL
jgi:hypothetical protein